MPRLGWGCIIRKSPARHLILVLPSFLLPNAFAQQVILPAHAPWFNVDLSSGRIDYQPIQTTWLTLGGAPGATHVLLPDRDTYSPGAQGNVSSMSIWFKLTPGWAGGNRFVVQKTDVGNYEYDLFVSVNERLRFRQFSLDGTVQGIADFGARCAT